MSTDESTILFFFTPRTVRTYRTQTSINVEYWQYGTVRYYCTKRLSPVRYGSNKKSRVRTTNRRFLKCQCIRTYVKFLKSLAGNTERNPIPYCTTVVHSGTSIFSSHMCWFPVHNLWNMVNNMPVLVRTYCNSFFQNKQDQYRTVLAQTSTYWFRTLIFVHTNSIIR